MADSEDMVALQRLQQAVHDAREYAGGASAKSFIDLLTALERCYLFELANVAAEKLQHLQAAVAQVRALRRVFSGDEMSTDARI